MGILLFVEVRVFTETITAADELPGVQRLVWTLRQERKVLQREFEVLPTEDFREDA
jgi:hypothetical protein